MKCSEQPNMNLLYLYSEDKYSIFDDWCDCVANYTRECIEIKLITGHSYVCGLCSDRINVAFSLKQLSIRLSSFCTKRKVPCIFEFGSYEIYYSSKCDRMSFER